MERFPLQGPIGPIQVHPRWWGFVYGVLPAVLMIVLIVVLVIVAIRLLRDQRRLSGGMATAPSGSPQDDAAALVRLRYARGEIDRDSFLRISGDLGKPVPTAEDAAAE